jgi:hypothetical protein
MRRWKNRTNVETQPELLAFRARAGGTTVKDGAIPEGRGGGATLCCLFS